MFRKSVHQIFAFTLIIASLNIFCMEQAVRYTPENTKFAFDFHDVVAKAHPYRVINGLFNWNMIPELNWNLPYNTAHFLYHLPGVIAGTAQLAYNRSTGEQYYDLFQRNGLERIALAVRAIANDLDVINGTIKIINELKDKGYQVDMASDIGASFLQYLETQKKFIDILSLFNNKKSVDYIHTPNPAHKPDKQFFIDYQNAYNKAHMNIIFIDDKQKNVDASEATGMIGIQFQNPEQLRNELVKRGILD
jgi:FMN phosphatase YigB (HAD superfamily)